MFVTEKRPSLTWTDVITPEKSPPGETPVDSQYSSSNQLSSLPDTLDTSVQSNTLARGRLPETPYCPYFLRAFLNTPITCLCTKIRLWLICLVVIVTLVLIIVGAIYTNKTHCRFVCLFVCLSVCLSVGVNLSRLKSERHETRHVGPLGT